MNFKAFAKNENGAIALVFGFALIIIVLIVGVAIDTGRAFSAASSVTALLDAAALAASKEMAEQELSKADAEAFAQDYFMRTLTASTMRGVGFEGVHADADPVTGMVKLDINFEVPTTFARAANVNTLRMHRSSTAALNLKRVELAMVLDITGSMSGQKIADLKMAAKDLVGIMLPDNKPATNRIAVVPYSAAVNAGGYAAQVSNSVSTDNCVFERGGSDAFTEAVPAPGNYLGAMPNPVSPANPQYVCPAGTLLPLTSNRLLLENTIDSYRAGGWTAGHIGLAWGWYLVSPDWAGIWPAASTPRPYDPIHTLKVVILMTDGEFNTSYDNGPPNATSTDQALYLCDNMKAAGKDIQIYTVAFQAPLEAQTALQTCASDTNDYFDAVDGASLRASFQEIAARLQSLRLAK